MIEHISSWAEQIVIAVIIVTIIEMILPKGNSKKYIKTIIGIYILYVIISPVIKLASGGNIKLDYEDYEKYFNTGTIENKIQTASVETTYKIELEKKLKMDIQNMGYNVIKANIQFDLEKGTIKEVILSINKEKQKGNHTSITVNKVEVGSKKEENTLSNEDIQKIIQKINEDYGVKLENIKINSNVTP